MTQTVHRRVTIQPGGKVEVVAEELPPGSEASVFITVGEPKPAVHAGMSDLAFKEEILRSLPEIDLWVHHGEVRAKLKGTGLEVWEIITAYVESGQNFGKLIVGFNWLSFEQLRQALVYAHIFPEEIGAYVRRNFEMLPDDLRPDPLPSWP
ncbi:MAG: hypothetical protein HYX51_11965 [Chloroflexi bacterium]|nr:hypothetical protein [Chloroflexota bacterium]